MARFPWGRLPLELQQAIILRVLTDSKQTVDAIFSKVTPRNSNGIREATKTFVTQLRSIEHALNAEESLSPILAIRKRAEQRYNELDKPDKVFNLEATTEVEIALQKVYEPMYLHDQLFTLEQVIARLEKKIPKAVDPEKKLKLMCEEAKAAGKERKQRWGWRVAFRYIRHMWRRTPSTYLGRR